jgi:hypothetical protein
MRLAAVVGVTAWDQPAPTPSASSPDSPVRNGWSKLDRRAVRSAMFVTYDVFVAK